MGVTAVAEEGTMADPVSPRTPMSPSYGVTPSPRGNKGNDLETINLQLERQIEAKKESDATMLKQMAAMQATIEGLSHRCMYLDRSLAKEKEQRQKDLEENNALILKQVHDFRTAFEMERVSRLEREAQILKRIGEDKQQLLEKLDAERMSRESSVNVVRDELTQTTDKLSRMLQMETTHRGEREDDILRALNQYSVLLQSLTSTN